MPTVEAVHERSISDGETGLAERLPGADGKLTPVLTKEAEMVWLVVTLVNV